MLPPCGPASGGGGKGGAGELERFEWDRSYFYTNFEVVMVVVVVVESWRRRGGWKNPHNLRVGWEYWCCFGVSGVVEAYGEWWGGGGGCGSGDAGCCRARW